MRGTFVLFFLFSVATFGHCASPPNVLVVITDDQGFGDLGYHGNPVLKTPNLDAFAKDAIRFTRFYVSPVCSPTRSSLLTGRWTYRTGVVDTYLGRSMMHADETTLAEALQANGYRTGLFGKWHLGDNYPMRPQDQGFQEVLMHRGGGIAQPSDPPNGSSYHNPVLFQNGQEKAFNGYVTDVFTDAAINFIKKPADKPFFSYVAYNCPHGPYQVQDADRQPYDTINEAMFPKIGQGWTTAKMNVAEISKAYGMIANIDMNFKRLIQAVPENTLIIFLTDNGPGGVRWNGGLRNRKGMVYEGGIRVPCFMQWKARWKDNKSIDTPAAHIDLFPTILAAAGATPPKGVKIDGVSLLPLIEGTVPSTDRNLFIQWHRGDVPEPYHAFTAIGPRYKLLQAGNPKNAKVGMELFDIPNDPYEQNNLAAKLPEEVTKLKTAYDAWFADVKQTRNFEMPRIVVGADQEPTSVLTRQDWRGTKAGWQPGELGQWEISVAKSAEYKIRVRVVAKNVDRQVTVTMGNLVMNLVIKANQTTSDTMKVQLKQGPLTVIPTSDDPKIVIDAVTIER